MSFFNSNHNKTANLLTDMSLVHTNEFHYHGDEVMAARIKSRIG